MKDKNKTLVSATKILNNEERSDWTCYLFGCTLGSDGIIWSPNKGKEPNWFWRLMQYLILGNKWVKVK